LRGIAIAACIPLALSGLHLAGPDTLADNPTSTVSWDAERQRVDGFGGSLAFHKAGSIQRLGEPLTSEILDMIFDRDAGTGLDIVRVMVGDGSFTWGDRLYDGPTEAIMPEPGVVV
jgi:glucuronoarabinoxylan endo-1,4-beta-xylanase